MVRSVSRTLGTESLSIRPRARILRTLGDELISNETVAIVELVKNAYDADATRVMVRFNGPLEAGQGSIEVLDNGHGMSFDTIRSAWMEPANPAKRRLRRSEKRGRRLLGEKGIGRFAASRLARFLEVVSRRAGTNREVRAVFDWEQFDDEDKFLDEIEVLWDETPPSDISPRGEMCSLWEKKDRPDSSELTHGTILRMQNLTVDWDEPKLRDLRSTLSRLVSPFLAEERVDDEFQILLQLPSDFGDLSGAIEPPEAFKNPPYVLKGSVDGDGSYNFDLTVKGKEEHLSGQFVLRDEGPPPRCGPFDIELRVWDRDQALGELARQYGAKISDVRRDLDQAAGINVYRDGFRVLPYGEPRNDWLRLNYRRVQNPTLRLSSNQVVGYVLISLERNPDLRDQSNREGLIEGPALDDLRRLIEMAMTQLETRRYAVRERQQRPEGQTGGLFADLDFKAVRDAIKQRYPDDKELLSLVGETGDNLEKRVEKVQEVLARYRRLATLGQLVDTVLHEGRAPLSKIDSEAFMALREIERTSERSDDGLLSSLKKRLEVVRKQSNALETVFRKIAPFGGRKRGRPSQVSLERIISDAFSVLDSEITRLGVQIEVPKSDTLVTVEPTEIEQVFINLLDNSLYWLRQTPKESRRVAVRVSRTGPEEVKVFFSDSGPGVQYEFGERIFDPYFSTKPDGVGLGLAIAGEIAQENYGGKLELVEDDSLPGATFRVTLRRRA